MTAWTKQPAIDGAYGACACCGPNHVRFHPEDVIAVGFGYAGLTRDGQNVWSEPLSGNYSDDDLMTGAHAESLAAADPDHDWRIQLEGPLRGRTYQRHGPGEWVLIAQNEGFA